jgi:predicted  nucleic acid-binding Zn-ribbon protein
VTTPDIAAAASETIKNLAVLQEIDDELAEIALERGNLPEELEKLGAKITEFKTFIAEKRIELKEAGSTVAEHTNHLADAKAKLEKFQQQLYAVKTTREYDALTTEIEGAKAQIAEFELSITKNSNRTVELTAMLEEREAELENLHTQEAAKSAELKEKLAETAGEENELHSRRKTVVVRILPNIYSHYERVRDAKGGRGVVRLTGGACGGCFALIPHQQQVEIRKLKDIHACEACGRYLVPEASA